MYLMRACRFITINNFIALHASILFEEMLKKECCKHYRHVKFKGTMTKWPVHRKTHRTIQKHRTPRRNRHSGKQTIVCFVIYYFIT